MQGLQAAVRLERVSRGRVDIWARVSDGSGTTHTVRLTREDDSVTEDSWHVVKGDLRSDLPRPLSLLAIETYEPPTSPIGSEATLTIDSIHSVDESGNASLISDFNRLGQWHPMVTSLGNDTQLTVIDDGIEPSGDGRALEVAMGRGTDDGVRGIYFSDVGPITVPILANSELLGIASLSVGDRFIGQAYGRFVPFEIRGTFDLFPTMTSASQTFGIANVEALLSYLTPVSEPFLSNTAELFLEVGDGVSHEDRIAAVKGIEPALRVADRARLLQESSSRLGDAAGWRIVGTLISGATVTIALIALFAITVHHQDLTRLEAALVESLGGSRLGVVIESATRVVISLSIGYVLGSVGGIYGVRFVADRMNRTSTGDEASAPDGVADRLVNGGDGRRSAGCRCRRPIVVERVQTDRHGCGANQVYVLGVKHPLGSSRRAAIAALPKLVLRRAVSEKVFVGLRLIGLTIAVAVSAGVFIYLDALGQSALSQSLEGHSRSDLNISVRARLDAISSSKHTELANIVADSRTRELAKILEPPVLAAKSVTLVFEEEFIPWKNARTFLAYVDGIRDAADIVAGRWPSQSRNGDIVEVAISTDDATYLGAELGEKVHLSSPTADDIAFDAQIVGIYERSDRNALQWIAVDEGLGAVSTAFVFTPFVVD